MAAQKKTINLLFKERFDEDSLGRFVKWALSFGKYIVILTQLIVIIAFFARFKLDQDLNKLGAEISDRQNRIASFGVLENNVKIAQKQIASIKENVGHQIGLYEKLTEFSKILPSDTFLTELNFSETTASFSGESPTEASFGTLLASIQKSQVFKDIIVESISSGGAKNPTILFKIKADFKKE